MMVNISVAPNPERAPLMMDAPNDKEWYGSLIDFKGFDEFGLLVQQLLQEIVKACLMFLSVKNRGT